MRKNNKDGKTHPFFEKRLIFELRMSWNEGFILGTNWQASWKHCYGVCIVLRLNDTEWKFGINKCNTVVIFFLLEIIFVRNIRYINVYALYRAWFFNKMLRTYPTLRWPVLDPRHASSTTDGGVDVTWRGSRTRLQRFVVRFHFRAGKGGKKTLWNQNSLTKG